MSVLVSLVAACGGGGSSSDNSVSSNDDSNNTSEVVVRSSLSVDTANVGEEVIVTYNLSTRSTKAKGTAGTIHWGDVTGERVSGSGTASHSYTQAGEYSIKLRADDGSVIRLGSVTINAIDTCRSLLFIPTNSSSGC